VNVQVEARRESRALILACLFPSLALSSRLPEPTGRHRASARRQSSSLIFSLHNIYVFKYHREHSVAHLPPIRDWKRSWRMHAHARRELANIPDPSFFLQSNLILEQATDTERDE
jgi:hypothetical protein